jgi:hypothetical protein
MYNIGKYLLLVEKRVDIHPLKPSVVHKNHDKSVLFHSYIHSILYKVPILFTSCRAKCRFYLLLVENLFTSCRELIYFLSSKVPILFTSCREHFSQNTENQFFASKAKPYINFNKVSNKRLDNFSKVIEASFECSWSIGSLRLHGWRHHSRCNSILVRTDCVI